MSLSLWSRSHPHQEIRRNDSYIRDMSHISQHPHQEMWKAGQLKGPLQSMKYMSHVSYIWLALHEAYVSQRAAAIFVNALGPDQPQTQRAERKPNEID